jgi:hypothetical protein
MSPGHLSGVLGSLEQCAKGAAQFGRGPGRLAAVTAGAEQCR